MGNFGSTKKSDSAKNPNQPSETIQPGEDTDLKNEMDNMFKELENDRNTKRDIAYNKLMNNIKRKSNWFYHPNKGVWRYSANCGDYSVDSKIMVEISKQIAQKNGLILETPYGENRVVFIRK